MAPQEVLYYLAPKSLPKFCDHPESGIEAVLDCGTVLHMHIK
jgi:hypothetical protein